MKKYYLIFFSSILLYLLFISFSIGELPKYDEVQTLETAEGIYNTGKPIRYVGEEESYQFGLKYKEGYIYWLPHTILYWYGLAFFFLIFGKSVIYAKLFGVFCIFLNIILIFLISKEIFGKKFKKIALIASSLLLINPAIIQFSLLIIYDNTLLTTTLLLFVYFFIKSYKNYNVYSNILLGVILAINLWVKETTPILLPFIVLLFYILKREYRKAIISFLIILSTGFFFFFITWLIYTNMIGTSWDFFLKFAILSRASSILIFFSSTLKHLSSSIYDLFWFSPPFIILLLLSIFDRIKTIFKKGIKLFDFFIIFIIVVWFAYAIKAPHLFYKFPILPLSALLISYFIVKTKLKFLKKDILFYSIIVLSLFIFYNFLKDPILLIPKILPLNQDTISIFIHLFIYLIPLIIIPIFIKLYNKDKLIKCIVLSCILILIPMNISLDFKQAFADYSTVNTYGLKGFKDTIDYIKKNTNNNDLIIIPFDMGYYIENKFYESSLFTEYNLCGINNKKKKRQLTTCGVADLIYDINVTKIIKENDIIFFVYSNYNEELTKGLTKETKNLLNKYYFLDKNFGNFYIYKMKNIN